MPLHPQGILDLNDSKVYLHGNETLGSEVSMEWPPPPANLQEVSDKVVHSHPFFFFVKGLNREILEAKQLGFLKRVMIGNLCF